MNTPKAPSQKILLEYAAGTLRRGPALVVETHLALNPMTRERVARLEELAGALLDSMPPAMMHEDALSQTIDRIDSHNSVAVLLPAGDETDDLPHPLRRCSFGPWKSAGPGVRYRRVLLPEDDGCPVIVLKINPGRSLPQHTHMGTEFSCVVSGSYRAGDDRFSTGDFDEADEETSHRPRVEGSDPCICVAALDNGQITLDGPLFRLLRPFARIRV